MKCSNIEFLITDGLFREFSKEEQKNIFTHIFCCDNCKIFYNIVNEIKCSKTNDELVAELIISDEFNSEVLKSISKENTKEYTVY